LPKRRQEGQAAGQLWLTDRRGCPVAVSVHKGNTGDPKTFLPQVRKLREKFGLEQMVIVGDRGMISQASIEQLREEHFSWITALKSAQKRAHRSTPSSSTASCSLASLMSAVCSNA
jgi:transposase